jgi:hypothetical protein
VKISPQQLEAVLALPGPRRFAHFVKVVADWYEVWGLFQDGWALAADEDQVVFPLWPAKEYAQLCARAEWDGYIPRAIDLGEFREVLLPKLKADGMLAGVFFTPASKGLTLPPDELNKAIEAELQNY